MEVLCCWNKRRAQGRAMKKAAAATTSLLLLASLSGASAFVQGGAGRHLPSASTVSASSAAAFSCSALGADCHDLPRAAVGEHRQSNRRTAAKVSSSETAVLLYLGRCSSVGFREVRQCCVEIIWTSGRYIRMSVRFWKSVRVLLTRRELGAIAMMVSQTKGTSQSWMVAQRCPLFCMI